MNLYGYVGNSPINCFDPFGLDWEITRDGKPRATAVANDATDTFATLAKALGFDVSDVAAWLQTTDKAAVTGKKYSIPNTIFFDYGPGSAASWFGLSIFDVWRNELEALANRDRRYGYNVVETQGVSDKRILDHLGSPDIVSYYYEGHGAGSGIINASNNSGVLADRYTKYGIASLTLYACQSAEFPNRPKQARYRYSPWESNVSTEGFFTGFLNAVGLLTQDDGMIAAPGINGQPVALKAPRIPVPGGDPGPH